MGGLNERLDHRQGAAGLRAHLPRQPEAVAVRPGPPGARWPHSRRLFEDAAFRAALHGPAARRRRPLGRLHRASPTCVSRQAAAGLGVDAQDLGQRDLPPHRCAAGRGQRRTRRDRRRSSTISAASRVSPRSSPLIGSTSAMIYGGTNEIQRNILARQVLDLPGLNSHDTQERTFQGDDMDLSQPRLSQDARRRKAFAMLAAGELWPLAMPFPARPSSADADPDRVSWWSAIHARRAGRRRRASSPPALARAGRK